jgi:DNA-binding CsgD family transcriptional regulator
MQMNDGGGNYARAKIRVVPFYRTASTSRLSHYRRYLHAREPRIPSSCSASPMKLTDEEARYIGLLARGMTFEEMAVELDWTIHEVDEFGTKLFDRIFVAKKRSIN